MSMPKFNNNKLIARFLFSLNTLKGLVLYQQALAIRQKIGDRSGVGNSLNNIGLVCVIVSLWSVPDAPTDKLMTEFYHNWRERKLDKAQALRQAMLKTMENHPNPKDWAAFTLIGEAE